MPRKPIASVALALLLAGATAFAANPAGRWGGKMPGPEGAMIDLVYTIANDDGKLTGSVDFVGLGEVPISDGTARGDSVFFTVDAVEVVLGHRGRVVGDSLYLTVTVGPNEFPNVLTRLP